MEEKRRAPALALAFALFLALHLAASFLFPESIWGAHHLRYLAPWSWAVCAAALGATLVPPAADALWNAAAAAGRWVDRKGAAGKAALALAAAALLALFRTRNLFLGDGYLIASVVQSPGETGMGAAGFVSLTIHKGLFALFRAWLPGTEGACPFAVTSILAGVAALFLLRGIARRLVEERESRALLFASLAGSGAVLLFFGYVEHYTLMQAALLLYLLLAIRYLRGEGTILAPAGALALAAALHLSALALAPASILLLFRERLTRRKAIALLLPAALAAAGGLVFLAGYTEKYYRGLGALLPLLAKGDHAYVLFSADHFAFAVNELLLLLGGALLLPFAAGRAARREETREGERAIGRFLAGTALLGLLYLLLVDPFLGGRDWDLMALPAFPFALLLGWFFVARREAPGRRAVLLVMGAVFLHTFPWIAAGTDRDRATAMTVAMVARDPHYENRAARAPKSFGVLLTRAGYDREAGFFYEKASARGDDPQDLFNLATNKARRGAYREAVALLERAIELEPGYAEAYVNLALARIDLGENEAAEEVLRSAIALAPESAKAHLALGIALANLGRYDAALASVRAAAERDPSDAETWARLALLHARAGDAAAARAAAGRALALDPENGPARRVMEATGGPE